MRFFTAPFANIPTLTGSPIDEDIYHIGSDDLLLAALDDVDIRTEKSLNPDPSERLRDLACITTWSRWKLHTAHFTKKILIQPDVPTCSPYPESAA